MQHKLALIGAGYWGANLIREFNKIGFLYAICDTNTATLDKHKQLYPNIKFVSDWNDILADKDITAVCIALPTEMHYKFAKSALLANKDVFVEKPMTMTVEDSIDLLKIAKDNGKILMVGHLLHYHPAVMKIKELQKDGTLGKIKNITSNRFNLGIFRTTVDVLWSLAPHDISVITSLCNNALPTSVVCKGKDVITKGIHDITNSILCYDKEDIYVNINVNWLNAYKEQRMTIIGENAMIVFDDMEKTNKLKIYKNYIDRQQSIPTAIKSDGEYVDLDLSITPLEGECRHFLDCCISRKEPITSGEEGYRVVKILDMLTKDLKQVDSSKQIVKPNYYAHETAIIDDDVTIGEGTKIWHFSHICKGAVIGKNCSIGQNCYIAGVLGDNCRVQNNVSIYAGVNAGNNVFFGPSCVLTNDINPRAKYSKHGKYMTTTINDGVTLGANCTIICGHTIGKDVLVGAGAVVTKDIPDNYVVVGNPAKRIGLVDEFGTVTHDK